MSGGAQTHLRLIVLDAEHPNNRINKGLEGNPSPPRYVRRPRGSDARGVLHKREDPSCMKKRMSGREEGKRSPVVRFARFSNTNRVLISKADEMSGRRSQRKRKMAKSFLFVFFKEKKHDISVN